MFALNIHYLSLISTSNEFLEKQRLTLGFSFALWLHMMKEKIIIMTCEVHCKKKKDFTQAYANAPAEVK